MRLDSLIRLIESADFMAFRELAIAALELKGMKPAMSDGARDGGTDLRLYYYPPNPTNIAVAISVQKDWKSKARTDALSAKQQLGLDHTLYVSSRRIPEADFSGFADDMFAQHELHIRRMDSQELATVFNRTETEGRALKILGIEVPEPGAIQNKVRSVDYRERAVYAFLFLGSESEKFTTRVIESSIISVLYDSAPLSRATLINNVLDRLALPLTRLKEVQSEVDRMLQRTDLLGSQKSLTLSPELRESYSTMAAEKEVAWRDLTKSIATVVRKILPSPPTEDYLDSLMNRLGSLLMVGAESDVGNGSGIVKRMSDEVTQLEGLLEAHSDVGRKERQETLKEMVDVASLSSIAKELMAGHIFRAVAGTDRERLFAALGGSGVIKIFMETSVAIPALCALLYEPIDRRFAMAAHHAVRQIQQLGLAMVFPYDYLEEMASHLVDASRNYVHIVGEDGDLTASTNAFVSNYASLRSKEAVYSFYDFIETFGYRRGLDRVDFKVARDAVIPKLKRLLAEYAMPTEKLPVKNSSLKVAQERVAYAVRDLKIDRPTMTLRHDARTIAYLNERVGDPHTLYILCTWDKIHTYIRERFPDDGEWDAMNPVVLSDLLSLSESPSQGEAIIASSFFVRMISERAAEAGAEVWDVLAKLEGPKMHDATLRKKARHFKEDFLKRRRAGHATEDIEVEWARWKASM